MKEGLETEQQRAGPWPKGMCCAEGNRYGFVRVDVARATKTITRGRDSLEGTHLWMGIITRKEGILATLGEECLGGRC